jgi:hypothetical protein
MVCMVTTVEEAVLVAERISSSRREWNLLSRLLKGA